MLNDGHGFKKVYVVTGYTDLRRGIDGRASIVKYQFNLDPFDRNTLFLFCGRRTDRIKGLLWEGDDFLLLYKRLGTGLFSWPRSSEEALEITEDQYKYLMEQLADSRRHRFGRSTEKLEYTDGQISFYETEDGFALLFNEAEAIADCEDNDDEQSAPRRGKKRKGKREEDIKDLPVEVISHDMTEEDLHDVFGDEEYKRLPDEIQREYYFKPVEIGITEHHIAVYSGKLTETMVKADHPRKLIKKTA